MSANSLHFFDAEGNEVDEGSATSVVQYDEATAERMGLKFKAAKDEPAPDPAKVAAENRRLADLDDTVPERAVKAKAVADEPAEEPAPAEGSAPKAKSKAK